MNVTPRCLLQIKQVYPELTGKYRDIADYILASPEKIIRNRASDIARECSCDNSLIIRFCQKVGYKGFSELKMSIAAEFMPVDITTADRESLPQDSFSRIRADFLNNNNKTLHDTVSLLNREDVKAAADILSGAGRIFLCGSGASGLVAMDMLVKLQRLGFNVVYNQDTGLNRMLSGLLNENDAVVAISFSGESREVCEFSENAAKRKIPVVGITNFPNSRLAGACRVKLLTASDEKVFRLGAMTSRLAQLLVADFLVIYMALKNIDQSEENVIRTSGMISETL